MEQIIESQQHCNAMSNKRGEQSQKYSRMAAQLVAAHAVEQLELIDDYIIDAHADKAALVAVVSDDQALRLCHEIDYDIKEMKQARRVHEQVVEDWKARVVSRMNMHEYIRALKKPPTPFKFLMSQI